MTTGDLHYCFGPVPSRRLGKSLGINNIPAKVCSYSCVYCQVGLTTEMQTERRRFFHPDTLYKDVQERLNKAREKFEQVDYLTFVPDGEPTLDLHLGEEITLLKTLGVPIGVITNSSLLWREDVREELALADWVSVKIDAIQPAVWRRVNRPHKTLRLPMILDGIRTFARDYSGKLVTETMLVAGINDSADCLAEVADFLHELQPLKSYLIVPTRPPAERSVRPPAAEVLNRAYQIIAGKGGQVEYLVGYEGNAFASTGDVAQDILRITAVHPMRQEAVNELLSRAGAPWEIVDRLVAGGDLAETRYDGHIFYVRRIMNNLER